MRCKACLRAQGWHFEHLMCLNVAAINLTSGADDRYWQYADNDGNNGFHFLGCLPGFNKENIDVEVTEDVVTVQAKQTQTAEEKQKSYVRHERAAQTYYRRIHLPEAVLSDDAKANLSNGILEIVLPKKVPKETKKLQIS